MNEWLEKIRTKELEVAARSADKLPYTTHDGRFDDWSGCKGWWTNGFYPGLMWLLYEKYGDEVFRTTAETMDKKLCEVLLDFGGMDHDAGFRFQPSLVKQYELTGDTRCRDLALLAASNMAGRFNPAGRFIRAWNDDGDGSRAGRAIIDCLMNLPFLHWASKKINDPRFSQIAVLHAQTAVEHFVRADGSAKHVVDFDPVTGKCLGAADGQGMSPDSSWTRGQAWALYGFSMCYRDTNDERFLDTAKRVAAYILSQLPEWKYMPVDYMQDKSCEYEDSTAAAITASGLLTLSKLTGDDTYKQAALKLLDTLLNERCDFSPATDAILQKCSAAYHEENHNYTIIYGDYYLTEALLKL